MGRKHDRGLKATERGPQMVEQGLMVGTALAPKIGYDAAAKIAKTAHKNGTTLRQETVGGGYLTDAEFDKFVDPSKMIGPG